MMLPSNTIAPTDKLLFPNCSTCGVRNCTPPPVFCKTNRCHRLPSRRRRSFRRDPIILTAGGPFWHRLFGSLGVRFECFERDCLMDGAFTVLRIALEDLLSMDLEWIWGYRVSATFA